MVARKTWPLCRSMPEANRSTEPAFVGAAPLTVSPVAPANPLAKFRPADEVTGTISMKSILLFFAPDALLTVKRPFVTVTVTVFSIQRLVLVGVPLIARTPLTLIL